MEWYWLLCYSKLRTNINIHQRKSSTVRTEMQMIIGMYQTRLCLKTAERKRC